MRDGEGPGKSVLFRPCDSLGDLFCASFHSITPGELPAGFVSRLGAWCQGLGHALQKRRGRESKVKEAYHHGFLVLFIIPYKALNVARNDPGQRKGSFP